MHIVRSILVMPIAISTLIYGVILANVLAVTLETQGISLDNSELAGNMKPFLYVGFTIFASTTSIVMFLLGTLLILIASFGLMGIGPIGKTNWGKIKIKMEWNGMKEVMFH